MMHNHSDEFEHEVALSFAGEDREIAEQLGSTLASKGISIFYDEYRPGVKWGEDMVAHLINICSRKARYCVMLISGHYPLRKWTDEVRRSVQELTMRDAKEYILPVRLDDNEVPGIEAAPEFMDIRSDPLESIATFLKLKLAEREVHPGPPPESHDLRSGNVPPMEREHDLGA